MQKFKHSHPIAGVALGELKITRIGPKPGEAARVAYLSHSEGVTVGEGTFWGPWSEQTQQLMDMLVKSIEADVVNILDSTRPEQLLGGGHEEDPDAGDDDWDDDDGLTLG